MDPATTISSPKRVQTACERVFGTTELLDPILGHILSDDNFFFSKTYLQIFNLHLVNKTFHSHIFGETITAQKLFLAPTLSPTEPEYLLKIDKALLESTCRKLDDVFARMHFAQYTLTPTMRSSKHTDFSITIDQRVFSRGTGSWAKLQLSNPPTYRLRMEITREGWLKKCSCTPPHEPQKSHHVLHCSRGITLGTLARIGKEALAGYQCCCLAAEWQVDFWGQWNSAGEFVRSDWQRPVDDVYIEVEE